VSAVEGNLLDAFSQTSISDYNHYEYTSRKPFFNSLEV
jgi:hypothetical protein